MLKIVFCSDGVANIGVGAVDSERKATVARFYQEIANKVILLLFYFFFFFHFSLTHFFLCKQAKAATTTINIVAIEGGDLAVREMSILADGRLN